MSEKIGMVAAVCIVLLTANLFGWLIYDRGYSDGAAAERRRCMEVREQERQLRYEAQLDAMTESADKAAGKLDSERQ